jgi:hypothetical protein
MIEKDLSMYRFLGLCLLSACLAACTSSGSKNTFPSHKLNFVFNETISLDETELDASQWQQLSSTATGRYALTEMVLQGEDEGNWSQKITISFYPEALNELAEKLNIFVSATEQQARQGCKSGSFMWSPLKEDSGAYKTTLIVDEMMFSLETENCEKTDNGYAMYRFVKTKAGIHQLVYVQKNRWSEVEKFDLKEILASAPVIVSQNNYETKRSCCINNYASSVTP